MYPVGYSLDIVEIRATDIFTRWMDGLQDVQGRARIQARIERLRSGLPGDMKHIQNDVFELRIHSGPGYRVYYTQRENMLVILLAGGKKSTQKRDVARAIRLAQTIDEVDND